MIQALSSVADFVRVGIPKLLKRPVVSSFLTVLSLLVLALPAVFAREWTYGQALLASIAGAVSLRLVLRALELFEHGEGIEWQSHSGGLGGGLAGWRLSTPIVLLILSAVFMTAMVTAVSRKEPASPKDAVVTPKGDEPKAGTPSKEEKALPKEPEPRKGSLPGILRTGTFADTVHGKG